MTQSGGEPAPDNSAPAPLGSGHYEQYIGEYNQLQMAKLTGHISPEEFAVQRQKLSEYLTDLILAANAANGDSEE